MGKFDLASLKANVLKRCEEILEKKIADLNNEIQQLRVGIANDSKSSMGDKYETSREMMQQEINRLEQQVGINKRQMFLLKASVSEVKNKTISNGSLVETSIGMFLIAVALGEVKLDDQSCFVISEAAPLAKLLMGKSVNQHTELNGKKIEVLNFC